MMSRSSPTTSGRSVSHFSRCWTSSAPRSWKDPGWTGSGVAPHGSARQAEEQEIWARLATSHRYSYRGPRRLHPHPGRATRSARTLLACATTKSSPPRTVAASMSTSAAASPTARYAGAFPAGVASVSSCSTASARSRHRTGDSGLLGRGSRSSFEAGRRTERMVGVLWPSERLTEQLEVVRGAGAFGGDSRCGPIASRRSASNRALCISRYAGPPPRLPVEHLSAIGQRRNQLRAEALGDDARHYVSVSAVRESGSESASVDAGGSEARSTIRRDRAAPQAADHPPNAAQNVRQCGSGSEAPPSIWSHRHLAYSRTVGVLP